MGIGHLRGIARLVACALAVMAVLIGAGPAAARSLTDSLGQEIENTSSDTTTSQLAGPPQVVSTRAEPVSEFAPSLGSTMSPEDDLAAALDALAAAETDIAAQAAIGRAVGILEGGGAPAVPDDRAYQGMPLLNWNLPSRVKEVANTSPTELANIDVRQVRFGDHALLDTWLLRFDNPDNPFTITWHITELGTSFGGQLAPATLLRDGSTQVGQHSLLSPLVKPGLPTGTSAVSRFHPAGAGEETRLTTQTLKVRMPPPRFLNAILDPNLKPGHETFAQLLPADDGALDRAARAEEVLGTDKKAAIEKLSTRSPERQIWDELTPLVGEDGALTVPAATAAAMGADLRGLVGAMRSRDSLPSGVTGDPAADVNVVLMNNEAYISRRSVRVAPGAKLKIAVTNHDTFPHRFEAVGLHDRERNFGADDWGSFRWSPLGESEVVAAGETRTFERTPTSDAFTLWLGDPHLGDQAGMTVELDRGPLKQSLKLGEGGALPLHQAIDASGRIWVTMEGTDELVRLNPTDDAMSAGEPDRFPLPGGISDPGSPPAAGQTEALLGPSDVAIDGHGMVWMTLITGNAIARLDPSRARPGSTDGIEIFPLQACDEFCREPPPPAVPGPLSREPLQMDLYEDGGGNTVIFFTEMAADRIGAIRVTPGGTKINETHFNCGNGCLMPLGIALDNAGRVYFSEGLSNRIGRLTLDQARPFAPSTIRIEHFNIPDPPAGFEGEFIPGLPECAGPPACAIRNPAMTTLPHSVQIDGRGRVWFTEEATEKVGYLDPAKATPNTTAGMVEVDSSVNDFKRSLAPADLAFDGDGKAFFADEYGDQIASATVAGDGAIEIRNAFRPVARNSFTDAPMIDQRGDLWFIESGANLITRISGVAAGVPLPSRSPLLTADTAAGTLTASGLRQTDAVDLRLLRGGATAAERADVAVTGGAFTASLPLRAGDLVEIVPKGAHAPLRFSFRVADLSATVGADGSVAGRARIGAEALADDVTIGVGATTATATIGAEDGAFSWAGGLDPATARGTLSWTAATVAARFRTVTPFGREATDPPPPGNPPPGNPPPGNPPPNPPGGGGGGVAPRSPRTPTPPRADKPKPRAKGVVCSPTRWLTRTRTRSGTRRTVPLLGLDARAARACLGRPAKRVRGKRTERWIYPRSLEVRLSGGRVSSFTLLGSRMRSAPDRAGVGTGLTSFRRALGTLARDDRRGRREMRGLVAVGSRYADVQLRLRSSGRVARVTVTLRTRSKLDRTARRLLPRGPR